MLARVLVHYGLQTVAVRCEIYSSCTVDVDGDTNLSMLKMGKQNFRAELNVPQRLTAGVAYDINDIWSMAFDAIYTDYGKNNTLVADYDNPALPSKLIL